MTRKEYLEALDQYLVTMSESEKADILSDYEEHFRVGLENGKTESQIAASLGSPYDVANQFLDGEKPKVPTYPARPATSAATSAATAAASAVSASRPAATGTTQGYTTQPRPAATGTAQGYTTQPRPAATGTSQGYTTQPRPAATGTTQGYTTQPRPAQTTQANPYRAAQTEVQPGGTYLPERNMNVYDNGIQNYTQAQSPQQTYSPQPHYSQSGYQNDGYVDYDRQAEERQYQNPPKAESKYDSTGIIIVIVLCVVLIPTVGGTIVSLLVGLYGAIVGFAAAGGSLIAVGTAFSAESLWICLGLIFIGISFLALTGLLVMAAIEGTKLFVKLIRYCIKECKKMITEGSF